MNLCQLPIADFDWPDVGNREMPCCDGSAFGDPSDCTCWEPEHDLDQVPADQLVARAPGLRSSTCDDCAYRGGSPERRGEDHVVGDAATLQILVERNEPFVCHQGMRRVVRFRHPSGATWVPDHDNLEAAYRPPIVRGVPYKADGTPADLCAGWASARLRQGSDR
jgi:hypothetical protein